jgi:hypothetical protein
VATRQADPHHRREDEGEEEKHPERLDEGPDEAQERTGVTALEIALDELAEEEEMVPDVVHARNGIRFILNLTPWSSEGNILATSLCHFDIGVSKLRHNGYCREDPPSGAGGA